jgi:hypothetical protein
MNRSLGKRSLLILATLASAMALMAAPAPPPNPPAASYGHTFWGGPSNSLRAGICCDLGEVRISAKTGKHLTHDALSITNTSAARVTFFWPPPDQRVELSITNARGESVLKTQLGRSRLTPGELSPIPVRRWSHLNYARSDLEAWGDSDYDFGLPPSGVLDLSRYFYLTNPGEYRLTYRARICFADTNGMLQLTVMPPVTVPVRVVP